MKVDEVVAAARIAKEQGSTRFCMGAAWRELGNKQNAFKHILDMVKQVGKVVLEIDGIMMAPAMQGFEMSIVDPDMVVMIMIDDHYNR